VAGEFSLSLLSISAAPKSECTWVPTTCMLQPFGSDHLSL
jgi:hypothetical protein